MRVKPKKSLGQNFLTDANILKKIVSACSFSAGDIVLEIGSGRGDLSSRIAELVNKLYAVEIDSRLYPELKDRLKLFPNCRIIEGDILKLDLSFLGRHVKEGRGVKIVGNIPYYISSPLIERLVLFRNFFHSIFITVQKEFSRRIAAQPGGKEYGSLSCFAQYYFMPELIFDIKRGSFKPSPKVDSSFLKLEVRREPAVKVGDEELFFRIIRRAFNQRRKTLRNSLRGFVSSQVLESFFKHRGINVNIRPECLSLEDFAGLSNHTS